MISSAVNTSLSQVKGNTVMDTMKRKSQQASFKTTLEDHIEKKERPKDTKLWDSCLEFESIFVAKMFAEMRKSVHKGELLHGGRAEEIFEDFLYDEYAKMTSKNSNLGMATMLYKQLS